MQAAFRASRLPGVVTSVTSSAPGRSKGTYHARWGTPTRKDRSDAKGLAIDLGFRPRQVLTPSLLAIFKYLDERYGRQSAELFYAGAPHYVKSGYNIDRLNRDVYEDHKDHIHWSIEKGTLLDLPPPLTKEQLMEIVVDPIGTAQHPTADGGWIANRKGEVFAFETAKYFGGWSSDTPGPSDESGRDCKAIVATATGNGYWLVSDFGEVFAYGDAYWTGNYVETWGDFPIKGAYRNGRQKPQGGLTLVRDDGHALNLYRLPVSISPT